MTVPGLPEGGSLSVVRTCTYQWVVFQRVGRELPSSKHLLRCSAIQLPSSSLANECHALFKENPYLGDKCFLAASDGYGIDYTAYDTWEEAEEAMKKAYNDSKPSKWDESCEDMSYCYGGSALLYDNGDTVYSWEIIRADLKCRKKSMDSDCIAMMGQTLRVSRDTANRIQKDLSSWADVADLHDRYGQTIRKVTLSHLLMACKWMLNYVAVQMMVQDKIRFGQRLFCLMKTVKRLPIRTRRIFSLVHGNWIMKVFATV